MIDKNDIQEDMTVVGSDGEHIGTVDKVEGDRIKLTKEDSANGRHNFVSCDLAESIEGDTLKLSQTTEEVKATFTQDDRVDEIGSAAGGA